MDIGFVMAVTFVFGLPFLGGLLDWEQDRVHNRKGDDYRYNKYMESLEGK